MHKLLPFKCETQNKIKTHSQIQEKNNCTHSDWFYLNVKKTFVCSCINPIILCLLDENEMKLHVY